MLIDRGEYRDLTSGTQYLVTKGVELKDEVTLLTGENGIGKTRFIEGVLLKRLKDEGRNFLYLGQDIKNQILSYNLIDLVKNFIKNLKERGGFFKAILFNEEDSSIDIPFNRKKTLNPTEGDIVSFIKKETTQREWDILILDEVDKYFDSQESFKEFLKGLTGSVFIISHILRSHDYPVLNFTNQEGVVHVSKM